MKHLARRHVLAGLAAGVAGVLVAPGARATSPRPAPHLTSSFTPLDVVTDAASLVGDQYGQGATIWTLTPYAGLLLYGYGDYGVNTGSLTGRGTNLGAYDTRHNFCYTVSRGYCTEAIETIRTFDSHVYVPNIDPDNSAPDLNSALTNRGGWHALNGVDAVHVFDVCEGLTSDELFLAGANDSGAIIWHSLNAGATWSVLHTEKNDAPGADGWERFYWLTRIGSGVYFRANLGQVRTAPAPMYRYDLITQRLDVVDPSAELNNGLHTTPDASISGALGDTFIERGAQVVATGTMSYFCDMFVRGFDGTQSHPISGLWSARDLTLGTDHMVYALTGTSTIVRISGLTSTTLPLNNIPSTASSLAYVNGVFYIGDTQGKLYAATLSTSH